MLSNINSPHGISFKRFDSGIRQVDKVLTNVLKMQLTAIQVPLSSHIHLLQLKYCSFLKVNASFDPKVDVSYIFPFVSQYHVPLLNLMHRFSLKNHAKEKSIHKLILLKFIYSEKATKFCEIFTQLLTTLHTVKSFRKILWHSQNI